MRFLLGLCALFMLCGCAGTSENAALSETSGPRIGSPPVIKFGQRSELGLINSRRLLRVGDSARELGHFFPRPDNAADLRDIPPGWEGKYRARGWQTSNESFGILIYEDSVALAIRVYEHADEEFFNEIVANYQARFSKLKPMTENAKVARYLFADSGKDRLMICATRAYAGDLTLTIAVGQILVMDALRMSPDKARDDAEAAETRFKVIG